MVGRTKGAAAGAGCAAHRSHEVLYDLLALRVEVSQVKRAPSTHTVRRQMLPNSVKLGDVGDVGVDRQRQDGGVVSEEVPADRAGDARVWHDLASSYSSVNGLQSNPKRHMQ